MDKVKAAGSKTEKPINYRTKSPDELLQALETAGRAPSLDLIRAAINHRAELTPGLLDLLAAPIDETWRENDPRRYAPIHAGLLLIFFREPQAVPIFMRLLRAPENENLLDWFSPGLASYGLGILPAIAELLNDPSADEYVLMSMVQLLSQLAVEFPTERGRAIELIRSLLPHLDGERKLQIPSPRLDKPNPLWTVAATALAELHDFTSRPTIEALYRGGWMDVMVMGDEKSYLALLMSTQSPRSEAFNLIATYEALEDDADETPVWDAHVQADLKEQLGRLNSDVKEIIKPTSQVLAPPTTEPFVPIETVTSKPIQEPLPELAPDTMPEPVAEPTPQPRTFAVPKPTASKSPFARAAEMVTNTIRNTQPKVGRNDPCPCGSGKKYKHCHGK